MLAHGPDYTLSTRKQSTARRAHSHLVVERSPAWSEAKGFAADGFLPSARLSPYPPRMSGHCFLQSSLVRALEKLPSTSRVSLSRFCQRRKLASGSLRWAKGSGGPSIADWRLELVANNAWWCPSVNSFKFQPCDHTPPGTQKLNDFS